MSDMIEVVLQTTVIEIVQDGLIAEVTEDPVVIEIVEGGLELASDIVSALNAANAPSVTNPFVTLADVADRLPLAVPVSRDWSSPDNCLLDVQDALGWSFQPGGGTQYALISLTRLTVGQSSSAALLVSMAGVLVVASYKVAWQAGMPEITFPAEEILLTAITNFDPASQSQVTAHVSGTDPHGDRAYADDLLLGHAMNHLAHGALTDSDIPASITRDTELQASMLAEVNARTGAIAAAIQGHVSDVDPHGDRAYVDAQRYSRLFMLGA